jgi:TIR domain
MFIDVDMRAGAKFPAVLEQRLAQCKVMLVLIGPHWLDSRDEQGRRRLESTDDWVRLEIAHALRRDITVIPVCVNGAKIPERMNLPEDIRGLLDHQATSVSIVSFRRDMAGLARDIHLIPTGRSRARLAIATTGALIALLAICGALFFRSNISGWVARMQITTTHPPEESFEGRASTAFPSTEWTLYQVSNKRYAAIFEFEFLKGIW